jgi:hypothetical protein
MWGTHDGGPVNDGRSDRDELDDVDDVDDDLSLALEPAIPDMHDDIPIRGYNRGEPIPDLGRLPQDRWREALIPLSPRTRHLAQGTVATVADAIAANILVGGLIVEAPPPQLRVRPPSMPRAVADPPARGGRRQVNFRLGPDEHARLLEAARTFGMRPGALARLLTVRGVDRALRDARRDL